MNDAQKNSITIKKYANRRLYNTATSSYVTLETLAGMVKEGIEFNVYDAKTGEDITRSVLTQIIVEEEGKTDQQNLLPVSFLRQLIGFYGNNMQWLVPKYLEHSMSNLSSNQEQLTNYFQTTFGNMFPFGPAFEEMSKQNIAMFERAFRMFAPFVATSQDQSAAKVSIEPEKHEPAVACAAPMPQEDRKLPDVACCQVEPVKAEPDKAEQVVPETPPPACTISVAPVAPPPPAAVESPVDLEASPPSASPPPDAPPAAAPEPFTPKTPPAAPVQSAPAAFPTADDMQEKIANLQRQLADLAKNRA